jgi:hypothetical protein
MAEMLAKRRARPAKKPVGPSVLIIEPKRSSSKKRPKKPKKSAKQTARKRKTSTAKRKK